MSPCHSLSRFQITQSPLKGTGRESYKYDPNMSISVASNGCPFSPSSYSTHLTSCWLYVIVLDTTHTGYVLSSNTSDQRHVNEYTLWVGVESSPIVLKAEQQMSSKVSNTIWQLHALFPSYRTVNQRLRAKIRSGGMISLAKVNLF